MSGHNPCNAVTQDKRCLIDDQFTLHESLKMALWDYDTAMQKKVCECSCWAEINDVYTPLFQQWNAYDPEVAVSLYTLQTMCVEEVVATLEAATIGESTGAQCAVNTLTVTLTPGSAALPEGSIVTLTGLNAELAGDELLVLGENVETEAVWTKPECSQWCSQSGLCPETGSATDGSCLAVPYATAAGVTTQSRCMQWCDKDSRMEVTTTRAIAVGETLVFSMSLLNPTYSQQAAVVSVSVSAPGLYIAPKAVAQTVATEVSQTNPLVSGVLSASISPQFVDFTVAEGACDVSNLVFDETTGKWLGGCAGMNQKLTVSMVPNVVLLAGARITIKGLVRSGDRLWPSPVLNGTDQLQQEEWVSGSGTLTLRVTQGAISPGVTTSFTLLFDMPQVEDSSAAFALKPLVSISASRGGFSESCSFIDKSAGKAVLRSTIPKPFRFIKKNVTQTKCSPGECNTISFDLGINAALQDSSTSEIKFVLSGFMGMERSADCMDPSCSDDGASIMLEDVVNGSNHKSLFRSASGVQSAATFDSNSGTVTFFLAKNAKLDAFKLYSVKWPLKNKIVGQDTISNNIKIFGFNNTACLKTLEGGVCTGEAVDGRESIKVCKPAFSAKVSQSYPWAGCDDQLNTITVTITPNAKVRAPSNITISGLMGAIGAGVRDQETIINQTNITVITYGNLTVCENGTIVNGSHVNGTIDYEGNGTLCMCYEGNGTIDYAGTDINGTNCTNGTNGTNCPRVCDFTAEVISTLEPFNISVDTVIFSPRSLTQGCFGGYHYNDSTKSLSLLIGANESLPGSDLLAGDGTTTLPSPFIAGDGSCAGSQVDGVLAADTDIVLQFDVMNPTSPQMRQPISISAQTPDYGISSTLMLHDEVAPAGITAAVEGDAAGLLVQPAKFVTAVISQSNPYPDADNKITVTLEANVMFGNGSSIFISNLVGSATEAANLTLTDISEEIIEPLALWNQDTGTLTVNVTGPKRALSGNFSFAFTVRNPGACQPSPEVSVSAMLANTTCAMEIPMQPMTKDHMNVSLANCMACGDKDVEGDHCEPCSSCSEGCFDYDAHPLKVHAPAFTVKNISQSTAWPGADNTLTLTLAANIVLTQQTEIHVGGFVGASNTSAVNSDDAAITWASSNDHFTIVPSADMVPGQQYVFQVGLKNPGSQQRPPVITLSAVNTGNCPTPIPIPKCVMTNGNESAAMAPMAVDAPAFVVRDIAQSSPFTSAINYITMTLSTNVELRRPTRVTISGLMGSVTPDNVAFAYESLVDGAWADSAVPAQWKASTGTLIMGMVQTETWTWQAGVDYVSRIKLMNPPAAQNFPLISVSADGIPPVEMMTNVTLDVAGGEDLRPLLIKRPAIDYIKVGQASPYPGVKNAITVTLKANAPIRPTAGGSHIWIGPFNGAIVGSGPIPLTSVNSSSDDALTFMASMGGVPGTAMWDSMSSMLMLTISSEMLSTREYVIAFDVVNPSCSQMCSYISAATAGLDFMPAGCGDGSNFVQSMDHTILDMDKIELAEGDHCPMKVYAPAFTYKQVSECSEVQGGANVLTFSLASNIDIPSGTLISISGLTNTQTPSGPVEVQGKNTSLFGGAHWTQSTGTLIMTAQSTMVADQVASFSINVRNPDFEPLAAVSPTIGATSSSVIMGIKTMSGLVLGAKAQPVFTKASISESSAAQGSYNTLMMKFVTNSAIVPGSKLTITGLIGTVNAPVESIKLSGMHPYYFDKLHPSDWDSQSGELVLHVVTTIPANVNRMVAFEVKNGLPPSTQSQRPVIMIQSSCPGTENCPTPKVMDGWEQVLTFAEAVMFTVKDIGQSMPYPGQDNTITGTLAANFEYRAGGTDVIIVEISNLQGASVKTGNSHHCPIRPRDALCAQLNFYLAVLFCPTYPMYVCRKVSDFSHERRHRPYRAHWLASLRSCMLGMRLRRHVVRVVHCQGLRTCDFLRRRKHVGWPALLFWLRSYQPEASAAVAHRPGGYAVGGQGRRCYQHPRVHHCGADGPGQDHRSFRPIDRRSSSGGVAAPAHPRGRVHGQDDWTVKR